MLRVYYAVLRSLRVLPEAGMKLTGTGVVEEKVCACLPQG